MDINVVRVFVNEKGKFGNPVGVILDEKGSLNDEQRQNIATKLGFSESVFINSLKPCTISIFNPKEEIDFAGHALVGTAFYVNKPLIKPIHFIKCRGGNVETWQENDLTWIRTSLEGTPPWTHREFNNPKLVEHITPHFINLSEHLMVWAWTDKEKGIIRARTFAPDWGIFEDQANGSGSMQLANMLGMSVEIHHGEGSMIYAKPSNKGFAEVGGRVLPSKSKTFKI